MSKKLVWRSLSDVELSAVLGDLFSEFRESADQYLAALLEYETNLPEEIW